MKDITSIAKTLSASGELDRYQGEADPIEQEVAYDLCEIVDSMEAVLSIEWPKMLESSHPREAGEALFEIREHLRHILYHIENSKYFNIVTVPKP